MYQGEGNRFVPGNDPAHLGGDTWVADAAIQMMERENWSGMFVTMGGIDKAGHMWGAQDDAANARPNCATLTGQTHVKCAAENADVQLGKLLAEVKKVDQARGGKTLVVLTADHGATYGRSFYGKQTIDAGDSNWYYAPPDLGVFDAGSLATGTSAPDVKTYSNPSTAVKNILDADGHLAFSYQSTAIEAWLRPQFNDEAGRIAKAQTMLTMPGVTAAYYRDGDHFTLQGTNAMTTSERSWWQAKAQDIVDTMAAPDGNGPDVIGLLHDNTSYGVYGDHGGAQESVQRVPMVFWVPGLGAVRNTGTFRTPDVMPTILQALGIPLTTPVDGTARPLG
jgi:arylsulfatase A-like enzyme